MQQRRWRCRCTCGGSGPCPEGSVGDPGASPGAAGAEPQLLHSCHQPSPQPPSAAFPAVKREKNQTSGCIHSVQGSESSAQRDGPGSCGRWWGHVASRRDPGDTERQFWVQTAPPWNKTRRSTSTAKPQPFSQEKHTNRSSTFTKLSFPNVFVLTTNWLISCNMTAVTLIWHIWLRLHALKIWN